MSERSLLEDTVDQFFSDNSTPEYVVAAEGTGFGSELWGQFEELGLSLPTVPEELGGAGGGTEEVLAILRLAGRHAVPLPVLETAFLAGWLLEAAEIAVPSGPIAIVGGDGVQVEPGGPGRSARVRGSSEDVAFASVAEHLLVVSEGEGGGMLMALASAEGAQIRPRRNLAAEPRDDVYLRAVDVDPSRVGAVPIPLAEIERRGALGRAVMMLGALEAARDLSIAHAREREQFGRPLARFQAVQGLLALIVRDVAVAGAAIEFAAESVCDQGRSDSAKVAAAKVMAGGAATIVSENAHQVHGAIGVTAEHPLHLLTRRLLAWRDDYGSEAVWSRRLGVAAAAERGGVWELISDLREKEAT